MKFQEHIAAEISGLNERLPCLPCNCGFVLFSSCKTTISLFVATCNFTCLPSAPPVVNTGGPQEPPQATPKAAQQRAKETKAVDPPDPETVKKLEEMGDVSEVLQQQGARQMQPGERQHNVHHDKDNLGGGGGSVTG